MGAFDGRADLDRRTEGFLAETRRWLDPGPATGVDSESGAGSDGRPRVLVIDDNADMREYLARLLTNDYLVTTAADGVSGLELARRQPPDLVLSDVMMPRLDGFGVLAALRADPATEHVPLVLLSARAGEESTVEGLEAGADDYLVKPFSARELLARVGANLELDRARRTRARLERTQALMDEAERLARVGSWELNLETGAMTASNEMLRQLHLAEADLQSGGFETVLGARVHPADLEIMRAAIKQTLSTGHRLDYEVRVLAADGSIRIYHTLGEVVRDADGQAVRLRASNQDITDQRAAEHAMAIAAANREAIAREHRIADELQQSLIPAPTFTPDNLAIATFYRAGVEGTQVGGDWYDVIELGAGRTALGVRRCHGPRRSRRRGHGPAAGRDPRLRPPRSSARRRARTPRQCSARPRRGPDRHLCVRGVRPWRRHLVLRQRRTPSPPLAAARPATKTPTRGHRAAARNRTVHRRRRADSHARWDTVGPLYRRPH